MAKHKLEGSCKVQGLSVGIENDIGSTRSGVDPDGKKWSTKMKSPYGYFKGTKGVDGDALDVFLGKEAQKEREGEEGSFSEVYIVHINDPETGEYDEDKVMFGYKSKQDAVKDFKQHYDKPERFLGPITTMPLKKFKEEVLTTKKNPRRLGTGTIMKGFRIILQ